VAGKQAAEPTPKSKAKASKARVNGPKTARSKAGRRVAKAAKKAASKPRAGRAKAAKSAEAQGFTRAEAVVGGFLMVLLHEAGHAMSDIFELPVLGREEDSADQLAAFVMLQFGPDVARTAINGAAFYWLTSWNGGDWFPHFDTHSTGSQRAASASAQRTVVQPQRHLRILGLPRGRV
jgi:hypothetical protein